MQIKYKISILYISTVAIILLLLCFSIYYFSEKDRTEQFQDRLKSKAYSILQLLSSKEYELDQLREINQSSSSALTQKSIKIYDEQGRLIFSDNDPDAEDLLISKNALRNVTYIDTYTFKQKKRDVIAIKKYGKTVFVAAYDDDKVDWLSKLKIILTVSFLLSILSTFIIGYFFSLSLVHSIITLKDKLAHISSKDLSLRLDTGKNQDELEQLAHAINDVLSRLQHSFETQTRFIDNASHELNSPLAVIMSQLDFARRKTRTLEEYKLLVDSVYEDVSRLHILLKTLLDLAKISGSEGGFELDTLRIDDLLMEIPTIIKKTNPDYKVKMVFDDFPEDESLMNVFGNEALLQCAVQNIVHNGCKYSKDHSATIYLSFPNSKINITIVDKGEGIDAEELEDIFYPFYRGSNADSTISSIGLGLSLSNNIIKLHNGNISVASEKNVGTKFIITLHSAEQANKTI